MQDKASDGFKAGWSGRLLAPPYQSRERLALSRHIAYGDVDQTRT